MTRMKKVWLFVGFIDMDMIEWTENNPFDVLRADGIHEKLVSLIEIVYSGYMVTFELGNVEKEWCKSE